jgi:hypothetical protein
VVLKLQTQKSITTSGFKIMKIFQPDNFSLKEIKYKRLTTIPKFVQPVISAYFTDFKINNVYELDRREINSKNYRVEFS